MHEMHPLRLQYTMFSDANPFMAPLAAMAKQVRDNRAPAAADNPLLAFQNIVSDQIVSTLDAWGEMRDFIGEQMFLSIYGSPLLQAAVGINPADTTRPRQAGTSPLYQELVDARIAQLKEQIGVGGLREGIVRAMLYVGMPRGAVDERGFEALRRIRAAKYGGQSMTLAEFKTMAREQFLMLLLDEEAAVAAIPDLLPKDPEIRRKAYSLMCEVLSAREEITGASADRLRRVAPWFSADAADAASDKAAARTTVTKIEGTRAS
jgi:hypothetical protein